MNKKDWSNGRTCSSCGENKQISEFYVHGTSPRKTCIICFNKKRAGTKNVSQYDTCECGAEKLKKAKKCLKCSRQKKDVFTKEFIEKVTTLYANGLCMSKIGKIMGCTRNKIGRCLRESNIKSRISADYRLPNEGIMPSFYNRITASAYSRGKTIGISLEYLNTLFKDQNGICPYLKIKLTLPTNVKEHKSGQFTASLDRIDSSKGYVEGNVQWVHRVVNVMKSSLTHEEFIFLCKFIANNFNDFDTNIKDIDGINIKLFSNRNK